MESQDPSKGDRMATEVRVFEALTYAKLGWAVLPLHSVDEGLTCTCGDKGCRSPGKHPRTKKGCHDASADPMDVCRWWNMWPTANIGVATGSKSGIVVVDIDPRHGGDKSWHEWSSSRNIPATLKVHTGGNGYHLYFRYNGDDIKNGANVLPGVDCRGEAGYVVAPGSMHVSGRRYEWLDNPVDDLLANLPEDIKELISSKKNLGKIIPFQGEYSDQFGQAF